MKKKNLEYSIESLNKIFEKCKKIIIDFDNILLSKSLKYINSRLRIQCNNGHIFTRNYKKIYQKKLCKKCRIYKNENTCKLIFEHLFQCSFNKCRPDWLRNPNTNRCLELDGFNEKLKLAFEYDGEFHYKKNKSTSYTSKKVLNQQERDKIKDNLCYKNNITLIRIPYTIKKENYQNYIEQKCIKNNQIIINSSKLDIKNIKHVSKLLDDIKIYAQDNNLKLLSNTYLNCKKKLEWKCINNHIFQTTYHNLQKRKHKCQLCK